MFDQTAFSLDSFDQDSRLFLIETPYADLSQHQRMYVTSAVSSIIAESGFAPGVADQIISVAALNNLSIMDAAQSVVAKHGTTPLVVRDERKLRVEKPVRTLAPKQEKAPATNRPMHSISDDTRITACSAIETEFVVSKVQAMTASAGSNKIFIQHQPKRNALEQTAGGS